MTLAAGACACVMCRILQLFVRPTRPTDEQEMTFFCSLKHDKDIAVQRLTFQGEPPRFSARATARVPFSAAAAAGARPRPRSGSRRTRAVGQEFTRLLAPTWLPAFPSRATELLTFFSTPFSSDCFIISAVVF
jgi:hypothetical protein